MGIISSTDKLEYIINNTIIKMIEEYSVWSNPQICGKLEAIYNNKLLELDKSEILKITYALRKTSTDFSNIPKSELCKLIVDHYKKRIELLRYIDHHVKKCALMIKRSKEGPVCRNAHEYIDDFFACDKIPKAIWMDIKTYHNAIDKFKVDERYTKFIENLYKHYFKSLKQVQEIINIIKQDVGGVFVGNFESIESYAKRIVTNMVKMCKIYVLIIINYK